MTRRPFIVGTAGHIDHGKTALVEALTGTNTDRLPQESSRGISIDLGFAPLRLDDLTLGVVDVPGHERFIRNMLAGASGIDLALIVVASDDSVMPQTREHVEILNLLGVRTGIIALTKCDLAEAAWIDLVEEDVRSLVAGTSFEDAPIVRTSARDGSGLDELRETIRRSTDCLDDSRSTFPFRMAIDRAFVAQGVGTIVTGTLQSGRVDTNDELVVMPLDQSAKVRSLQVHGERVETATAGQRCAMNLSGVHHTQVGRGCELAAAGYLASSRLLSASVRLLPESPLAIEHRTRVRLHIGTTETMATVSTFSDEIIEAGQNAVMQLVTDAPVTATNRQAFILRRESPLTTIGGGIVLQPVARPIRRRDDASQRRLPELASDNQEIRLAAAYWFQLLRQPDDLALVRDASVAPDALKSVRNTLIEGGTLRVLHGSSDRRPILHTDVIDRCEARILNEVRRRHKAMPLAHGVERTILAQRLRWMGDDVVLQLVLDTMIDNGVLRGDARMVADTAFEPALTARQREQVALIVDAHRSAGFSPPTTEELAELCDASPTAIKELVNFCVSGGELIHVGDGLHLTSDDERRLRRLIYDAVRSTSGLAVSEIRDLLDTSRRYAVPLCEYLDREGVTRRVGDLRVAAGV